MKHETTGISQQGRFVDSVRHEFEHVTEQSQRSLLVTLGAMATLDQYAGRPRLAKNQILFHTAHSESQPVRLGLAACLDFEPACIPLPLACANRDLTAPGINNSPTQRRITQQRVSTTTSKLTPTPMIKDK